MKTYARTTRSIRMVVLAVLALVVSAVAVVAAQDPGAASAAATVQSTRLPLPAGGTNPRINAVSCGSPGFCVAVGFYQSGTTVEGLIETLAGGQWAATTAPLPPAATGGGALQGVSCTGATCAAWGEYGAGPSTFMGDVLSGGTWTSAAITPPSGGTFPSVGYGVDGPITGVGCAGPGACTLVGNYVDSGNAHRGWVAAYSGGAWQPALTTVVPSDATTQGSALTGVSCGGGLCQAVGLYVSSNGFQSLEVSINSGGAMNSPFAGALPTGGVESDDGLLGIGCDASGLCTGYGTYYTSGSVGGGASNAQAYVVPIGGTGFQPQQPPTPTPQSTTAFPAAHLLGASCAGGDCVVTGYYLDTSSAYHPLIDRFTGGHWVSDAAPAGIYPSPVACASPSLCAALDTSTPGSPAAVFTGSSWTTLPVSVPGDASSTVADYATSPLACDSASACWVVGDYATPTGTEVFADLITTGSPTPTPTSTPTPAPGGGAITPAQVTAWFHTALVPGGALAHIKKILHAHGFTVTVSAGHGGVLHGSWVAVVKSGSHKKLVTVATATSTVPGSGAATVKYVLTPAGKKLLAHAHKLSISTIVTFTPTGGQPITVTGHGVLRP